MAGTAAPVVPSDSTDPRPKSEWARNIVEQGFQELERRYTYGLPPRAVAALMDLRTIVKNLEVPA